MIKLEQYLKLTDNHKYKIMDIKLSLKIRIFSQREKSLKTYGSSL